MSGTNSRARAARLSLLKGEATATAAVATTGEREALPRGHPLELWTIDEAAQRLRVCGKTLRDSSCPRVQLGRRTLFDPIETLKWARRRLTADYSQQAANA